MKHIAIVHSVAEIGGAERMSQVILNGLNDEHIKLYLVTPTEGPLVNAIHNAEVGLFQLPMEQPSLKSILAYLKQAKKWLHFLKHHNIEAVHTADPFCTRAIMPFCKIAGIKVITHFHFPFSEGVLKWAYGRFNPDLAVFCSNELQVSTGTILRCVSPRTEQQVIHNGVDQFRFSSPKQVPNLHCPTIGIIANLQTRKGHDEFITMASILKSRNIQANYLVIGGDILAEPRQALLEQKVNELGLSEVFTFTGQVEDVNKYLYQLDIFVCASHQEAFPVSILEAMASERIIVSTDVNGIPEALNSDNSILVSPKAPEQLADAVCNIIATPKEALARAKVAREQLLQHFTLDAYLRKWREAYEVTVG